MKSSNSEFKIYVNGTLEHTYTGIMTSTNADFWFGAGRSNVSSSPGLYFDGQIDKVKIEDAVLSSTEIEAIYNAGAPE
jgi:hypothetical protein